MSLFNEMRYNNYKWSFISLLMNTYRHWELIRCKFTESLEGFSSWQLFICFYLTVYLKTHWRYITDIAYSFSMVLKRYLSCWANNVQAISLLFSPTRHWSALAKTYLSQIARSRLNYIISTGSSHTDSINKMSSWRTETQDERTTFS